MRFRRIRTTEDDEPELNLIPLIDVLLMTLIFLLVTTSFSKEARLSVRLPEAAAEVKDNRPTLRVAIDAKGQYFINDQQLLNNSADTLRAAMGRAAAQMKDPLIVIHADAKTPHEAVVRVMDSARRLGLTRLSFATQQPADAP
jgi:biopolymer transport protein ExbD